MSFFFQNSQKMESNKLILRQGSGVEEEAKLILTPDILKIENFGSRITTYHILRLRLEDIGIFLEEKSEKNSFVIRDHRNNKEYSFEAESLKARNSWYKKINGLFVFFSKIHSNNRCYY